jgi:serine/threonine-protein kinase ULK/ATG1
MKNKPDSRYNIIFTGYCSKIVLQFEQKTKIKYIIEEYFKKIKKQNLLIKNIDNIYFISNAKKLDEYKEETMPDIYNNILFNSYDVFVVNGRENDYNYKIIRTIKEDVYANVYEAEKIKQNPNEPDFHVAIKKIKIERLKDDIKQSKVSNIITEEDIKPEIEKFNKELENMKICQCENSVKIFDYYYKIDEAENEKEFIIIMELCDETLFHELCNIKSDIRGFKSNQIRDILKQLNNVFKIMNENKIAHRDIKLNNILIKYLNKQKNKFKVLLSDYGISNRLLTLTGKFSTHVGNLLIMAPEILKMEPYNEKCDLWSLGVNIYQLYTKKIPYNSTFEMGILKEIKEKNQSVLDIIPEEDALLKDLLSKLLVEDPEKRISWEEYFAHPFFGENK